jgi:proteasome lid subunit RPN8/RPN11
VWSDGTSSLPELKISDCKIFNLFCDLWKASCFVKTSMTSERAAWIQYDVKNGYEFLWWPEPSTKTLQYVPSVTWKGDVPSNVIALAHTHPKNPKPSKKDISVAKRLKISIYAISRSAIWKVAPDGKLNMIASKDWYHRENSLCRPQFTKYLTPYGRQ